jgi:hypothetical protein
MPPFVSGSTRGACARSHFVVSSRDCWATVTSSCRKIECSAWLLFRRANSPTTHCTSFAVRYPAGPNWLTPPKDAAPPSVWSRTWSGVERFHVFPRLNASLRPSRSTSGTWRMIQSKASPTVAGDGVVPFLWQPATVFPPSIRLKLAAAYW